MSELAKWFEKRREAKAITGMQRHLATTMSAVQDLERAVKAAVENNEEELRTAIKRVTDAEKEADRMRRMVMSELAGGELPPHDREDLMHLMKRVDMVADWCRESTRVLNATPMQDLPKNLRESLVKMVIGVRKCATALRRCIDRMTEKPDEALQAADEVERSEEEVDDLYESSRILLGREDNIRIGAAILVNELLESMEMVADWCEDACDQVRLIIVRR